MSTLGDYSLKVLEFLMPYKQISIFFVRLTSFDDLSREKGVENATKYYFHFQLQLSILVQTQGEEKCTADEFLQ
jgi:hypothetical protein